MGISKNLEFKRLSETSYSVYASLKTNPLLMRHMPLADGNFEDADCRARIAGREGRWKVYGFGSRTAAAGSLKQEMPIPVWFPTRTLGVWKVIIDEIIRRAIGDMRLVSMTILDPQQGSFAVWIRHKLFQRTIRG